MTQVAPRQTASAKLHEALAGLKRAAKQRHLLDEGTPEHARAIALEEKLTRDVYELATAMDDDVPETTDTEHPA